MKGNTVSTGALEMLAFGHQSPMQEEVRATWTGHLKVFQLTIPATASINH